AAKATERAARPARTEQADAESLDRALAASGKVRPSGASRRKAKRESLIEAGVPASSTRKRRSGQPRPPAARRG
ncbi:MAG: hypothetical protein JWM47_443, partial [Acidimicrobiales bacterium]|nr:hypothetical protein [Acidimicrobiales bacterium]